MRDIRLCFFGDSFTNGFGDPERLGWTGRVCRAAEARGPGLRLTAYNLGIRRDTSRDLAGRWEAELAPRLPACVDGRLVFSFGANDTALERGRLRVSVEESVENCRGIVTAAAELAPVLMVGPAPVADPEQNTRIGALSDRYAELCAELGVPYLEVAAPLLAGGAWVREAEAGDGAHPGRGGYEALADLVDRWPAWRSWFP